MNQPLDRDRESPQNTPPPGGRGRGWLWLIAAIAAFVMLIVWLAQENPTALDDSDNAMRLTYLSLVLLAGATGLIGMRRRRISTVVKQAAAWIGIVLILALGYSYRTELTGIKDRLTGEFRPYKGIEDGSGAVTFRRSSDRHFHVEAVVDGVKVRFMVDTGASDVTLTPDDARRLGFDLRRLAFTRTYMTANGGVKGAPIRLGEIRIGPIAMRDVRASVNGAPMGQSLLGMSFLDRLSAYEVRQGTLTMRR